MSVSWTSQCIACAGKHGAERSSSIYNAIVDLKDKVGNSSKHVRRTYATQDTAPVLPVTLVSHLGNFTFSVDSLPPRAMTTNVLRSHADAVDRSCEDQGQ